MQQARMLYLAIASQQDGDAVYGTLHDTWSAAEDAARQMCVELQEKMGWTVFPHVMDLEYVGDSLPAIPLSVGDSAQ